MVLAARGADRTTFLQGMLSNDVAKLPGQGTHALLLTEQGRVVADLCVLVLDDAIWLDVPASSRERRARRSSASSSPTTSSSTELTLAGMALRGSGADAVLAQVSVPTSRRCPRARTRGRVRRAARRASRGSPSTARTSSLVRVRGLRGRCSRWR